MFTTKKTSISNTFFFYMILIATLSSFTIGIVWFRHAQKNFKVQSEQLKTDYLELHKKQVRDAVDNAANYISYKKLLTEKRLRQSIRKRVYEAHGIAENIYRQNKGTRSDRHIKKSIKQALRPVRFFDNRNYYFIDDLEGNSILYPPNTSFEGNNLMHITNKDGVRPFPDIIRLVKQNGEGYYVYNWVKYTEGKIPTDREYPKITFFKRFEPYNWFIAVGEYLDYVEDDIRKEILERVSQIKVKSGEFVTVHTHDGLRLASEGKVHPKPIPDKPPRQPRGQTSSARSDSGDFIFYDRKDTAEDTPRPGILFSRSLPDQEWIISAATYIDEVDGVIEGKRKALMADRKSKLFKIVSITVILWIFALILARNISSKSKKSFRSFLHFFKKAATEDSYIDPAHLHFSEFSELALSGNKMIAARQEAQKKLENSELRFRQIAENIREVFWIVSPDYREIVYISPAYKDVWGRSCEELYRNPQSWLDAIASEDRPGVDDFIAGISLDNTSEIVFPEYRIARPDGTQRVISARAFPVLNEDGKVYRLAGIAEDITEKKQSEEAMQTIIESSSSTIGVDFFNKVVQLLSSWLGCEIAIIGELQEGSKVNAISMLVDGRLCDDYTYDLAGTPCEVSVKEAFCYHPENIVSLFPEDKYLAAMNTEGYVGIRIVGYNNQTIGVLSLLSRKKLILPGRTRDILNIISARITAEIQRRKHERERDEIEARLRQSQKMESVGTMAGGIAHDFNNILGIIIGNADLAMYDIPEHNPLHSKLDEIITAGLRGRDIVKQLLSFSRKNDVTMTPVKIDALVKESAKLIRALIPTTIDITTEIPDTTPVILADATQIHQIIINLCTNASHAMEKDGGTLAIGLKAVELRAGEANEFQAVAPGRYVELHVSDSGEGMEPEVLRKVFDPYFTTKPVGKGTGMGLSVIHGIVKKHQGAIAIFSTPHQGTTVKIVFPELGTPPASSSVTTSQLIGGNEHILLVDDDEALAEVGKLSLERLGYSVEAFTDPTRALEHFKAQPGNSDLMVADITMPMLTGDKLAEHILKIRPGFPVILCSGYTERINSKRKEELGIRGFLEKPVDKIKLAEMVRKVLDEAREA